MPHDARHHRIHPPVPLSEIHELAARVREMCSDAEADGILDALTPDPDVTTEAPAVLLVEELDAVRRRLDGEIVDGEAYGRPDDTGERRILDGWGPVVMLHDWVSDVAARVRVGGLAS